MKIGVVFPQIEFGSDPAAIRDYAQTAEGLGFSHILAYDHVLGANPDRPGGWRGPYTYTDPFHEPFLLFSYMAALTQRIEFATGIIILPQRQTALVAKQAAQVDVLSQGRLRLGVGLGWNQVEYEALNEDFHTRGKRMDEQVEVMRLLWRDQLVTFKGQWHTISDAGIEPRPAKGSIPLWFGGSADPVLRRMARLGDGWMNNQSKPEDAKPILETLRTYLAEAGRSWDDFGLEPRINIRGTTPDVWTSLVAEWQALGATHLSFNSMYGGFTTPAQHIETIRQFAEVVGVKPG